MDRLANIVTGALAIALAVFATALAVGALAWAVAVIRVVL